MAALHFCECDEILLVLCGLNSLCITMVCQKSHIYNFVCMLFVFLIFLFKFIHESMYDKMYVK